MSPATRETLTHDLKVSSAPRYSGGCSGVDRCGSDSCCSGGSCVGCCSGGSCDSGGSDSGAYSGGSCVDSGGSGGYWW